MTANGRINDFDYEPGGCGTQALVYGIIIAIIFLFSGCKSIQYVPVETKIHDSIFVERFEVITDTVKENTVVRDSSWMSIHEADSAELANLGIRLKDVKNAYVIERNKVRELQNKLSSAKEKVVVKDRIVYKDKEVQVPYPVEKKLTAYQQFKQNYGGWAILLLTLLLLYVIIRFIKRFMPRGSL